MIIAITGSSGTGKSSSLFPSQELGIKGLAPKETAIINVSKKALPLRKANSFYNPEKSVKEGGNYAEITFPGQIAKVIEYVSKNRPDIKNLVVDDMGLSMSFQAMDKANEKGFDKFVKLAVDMFEAVKAGRDARKDLNVIFTFHQEKGDDGLMKIKTIGKMLDSQIYLDSLFTIILYSRVNPGHGVKENEYCFQTKGDGTNTCKAPVGMFDEECIPNDMGLVLDKIKEYYE